MLNKLEFIEEINGIEVIDTHTHLIGDKLCARDFWEIADYFWLFRELQAAGYPSNVKQWPEKERIAAFLKAYHASRNTMMNIAFTKILYDLYGIRIKDSLSVMEADEAIKASCIQAGWAQQVSDRLNVRRFAVNYPEHASFQGMREDALLLPRIDGKLNAWVERIMQSTDKAKELGMVEDELKGLLEGYQALGCPGVMTTLPRYNANANEDYRITEKTKRDQVIMLLLHAICAQLERHGMFMQLFLGVERSWCENSAAPANDPERIIKLYGLFERYAIDFELVVASELNNLDVVQAAWNFPNVHVGGMWWYNFRASTYKQSMQYRSEALPSLKSSMIVSDARCIEWTYGKILLVKKLLGQFLTEQVDMGWLDKEGALYLARGWLYESAAKRYSINGDNYYIRKS